MQPPLWLFWLVWVRLMTSAREAMLTALVLGSDAVKRATMLLS